MSKIYFLVSLEPFLQYTCSSSSCCCLRLHLTRWRKAKRNYITMLTRGRAPISHTLCPLHIIVELSLAICFHSTLQALHIRCHQYAIIECYELYVPCTTNKRCVLKSNCTWFACFYFFCVMTRRMSLLKHLSHFGNTLAPSVAA